MAQTAVTDVSQFSNTKVYTIACPRGSLVLNNAQTALVSSHSSNGANVNTNAATDDESKQFCIVKVGDFYYIYSPKLKTFAGLMGQEVNFTARRHVPFTITTDGKDGVDGSVFRLKATFNSYNYYVNNNNSGGIVLNSYSTAEGGNTMTFYEVAGATVNETEVLSALRTEYLDEHKVYKINNARVTTWTANADGTALTGTSTYSAAPEASQEFAFIKRDGKFYMYNVGTKKFVGLDGDNTILTANKTQFTPIDYFETTNAAYPFKFYLPAKNFYFNAQGSGGFAINTWSAEDEGNRHQLVEVAGADVYDEMLDFFEASYWDVTYKVYYNGTLVDEATVYTKRNSPAELPAANRKSFTAYTYSPATIETGVTEVTATATWDGPFEISTDFASAHWYDMSIRKTWYVTSGNKDDDGALRTVNANALGLGEPAYHWAFIGNPYDGFKILNKAEGADKAYAWTSKDNSSIPTFVDKATANVWTIKASTAAGYTNAFMLTIPTEGWQVNQFGGAGGTLKIWQSAGTSDAGSAFNVFDIPTNYAEFVNSEIAPIMDATGYFTLKDEVKATIGWDPAYKTDCPFETYKSLKEKLAAVDMTDLSNFILPETGYYTLKNNARGGTYMGIDPSDANMYGNYAAANLPKHIVKLTKTGDATYTIGLMGKFAPATVSQSTQVTATAEAGTYTVSVPTVGYAAFSANPSEQYAALHCAGGGSIVGWEAAAAASQWIVEDATSIELAIGAEGYATAYLPFPVEYGGTLPVPEAIGRWTFDDPDDLLAGTGIATLQATTHAKNNVTVTDLATAGITTVEGPNASNGAVNVPVGSSLLMAANNGATSMGTYSIMYDVCVEDGSTYVPLLQNSLTDGKDGSLFINKNKVGLGGGLNYWGSIENGKWYRIVFVVQPNGASLYVDGNQLVSNLNLATPYNQHWLLTTGALFFADEDGEEKAIKTSELRFWDVALNAEQVATLGSISGDAPKFPEALGTWTFEDATDPYAGIGTATLAEWGNGVTFADGVATVPVGAGIELNTNLTTTPTAYTLMQDVKLATVSGFISLFQNDVNNGKDGCIFINNGKVGLNYAGLGYNGTINTDTWYRIVTVIDNGYCTLYVDGVQVGKSASADVNAWAMRDSRKLILFIDNDGEEKEVQLAEARFWDTALTAAQVAELATVGTTIDEGESKDAVAYTAQLDGSNKWLVLNKLDGTIPTKTAVVLKGAPKTYVYNIVAEASPITDNVLKGTLEPIEATGKYILAKPSGKEIGFYKANSGNIAACKAYLEINSEIKGFVFKFDDDATGIDDIKDFNDTKNVNDSKAIYNLAGQRLNKMQKGINIINGKKVLY